MKSFAKSFIVALTLGVATSFASFAGTTNPEQPTDSASFKSGIYTSNDGKLHVALDKQTGRVVTIQLKNDKGVALYTQRLGKKAENCRLAFNVDSLKDGVYQLDITDGTSTTSKSVTLTTHQPEVPKRLVQTDVLASK
ncbi:hypothetical protein [Spirosoma sp. KUDC1026]|uniref:hypothetical protein n=1 Tax=Spirosoma sp. KUDC1026 TaxID=2745947 RepID=UPI00159B91EA|nr:hypothetical protein [Spirosoma sp. KUDC1026]QKZ15316.1 hypothetical protein HU175_22905 [Spirosoma sp. KUDC1026]